MAGDKALEALLAESASLCAEMRDDLARMRPQLLALKEIYEAYLDSLGSQLFVWAPQLPSGGHASLPLEAENECVSAVAKVLERRLAKVNKALGINDES